MGGGTDGWVKREHLDLPLIEIETLSHRIIESLILRNDAMARMQVVYVGDWDLFGEMGKVVSSQ
jgi:hypothetical protein